MPALNYRFNLNRFASHPICLLHQLRITFCLFLNTIVPRALVVNVKNGIGESVKSEKGGLKVAVEVNGGVVGEERGAEIHKPSHLVECYSI